MSIGGQVIPEDSLSKEAVLVFSSSRFYLSLSLTNNKLLTTFLNSNKRIKFLIIKR